MSIFNTDQLKLVSACLGRSKWLVLTGARARADQAMWQDKFQCDFSRALTALQDLPMCKTFLYAVVVLPCPRYHHATSPCGHGLPRGEG